MASAGRLAPNPKFVALRVLDKPPFAPILAVIEYEPSFAVILVGLFHNAPVPELVPLPAILAALVIGVPPAGQVAVAVIVPISP